MLKVCVYIFRGVEKALDQSVAAPVQAEVSEEAAPAGGEEANGPTAEEIAEAEAKVLTFYAKHSAMLSNRTVSSVSQPHWSLQHKSGTVSIARLGL